MDTTVQIFLCGSIRIQFQQEQITDIKTPEPEYITERPDDSELVAIDTKIAQASTTNQKAALYTQYLKDTANRDAKQKELNANKTAQEVKEEQKLI